MCDSEDEAARSVVAAHRATITARSRPDGGLSISVVIPRHTVNLNDVDLAVL